MKRFAVTCALTLLLALSRADPPPLADFFAD